MAELRGMTIDDHGSVFRLLSETDGVTVRDADSRDAVARYLERNPGLSFVAVEGGRIVGCLLGGHDGRRGYLHHLIVRADMRGRGIARRLVAACIDALAEAGIHKSHVDVLVSNEATHGFWLEMGWERRVDISRFSFVSSGNPDA